MVQRYEGAQSKSLRARKAFAISAITTGVLFAALIAVALNMSETTPNLDTVGQIIFAVFGLGFWVTVGTGILTCPRMLYHSLC